MIIKEVDKKNIYKSWLIDANRVNLARFLFTELKDNGSHSSLFKMGWRGAVHNTGFFKANIVTYCSCGRFVKGFQNDWTLS